MLGPRSEFKRKDIFCCEGVLNMTFLALNLSQFIHGVHSKVGPMQIVFAGKAHPQDQGGKDLIRQIFQAKQQLAPDIQVVYLENYDMELGKLITEGVDLWLNTPEAPMEASGTSGMKAALNGVPSLSILDGWWIEGCIEGITGWAIGENGRSDRPANRAKDAESLA